MDPVVESIDWHAALAEMEAKRDFLNTAITGLRAALIAGSLPGGPPPDYQGSEGVPPPPRAKQDIALRPGKPMTLPRGALLGKSGPDAIKLYLRSEMTKRTNREIGEALKQGGVESTSDSYDTFINSALFRLKKAGEVLRFDDGWGLAEWYPESFRNRVTEKAAPPKRKKPAKKKSTLADAARKLIAPSPNTPTEA